jgi:hypothetical protein
MTNRGQLRCICFGKFEREVGGKEGRKKVVNYARLAQHVSIDHVTALIANNNKL